MFPKPRSPSSLFLFLFVIFFTVCMCTPVSADEFQVEAVFEDIDDDTFFFDYPAFVLTDDLRDLVIVSDWGNNRIVVLDRSGNTRKVIRELAGPVGLAKDKAAGRLYVAEQAANRIRVFDSENFVNIDTIYAQNPPFDEPRGIWVDDDGTIYVVDTNQSRVVVFNRNGEQLYTFGREGMEDDQFYYPRGITMDIRGNLWIADTVHHAVKVFDRNGNFLYRFGQAGSGELDFDRVRYVSTAGEYAFVSDYNNHRVKVYDLEGNLQTIFGEHGRAPGQFSLPEGVWVDTYGYLWVADAGNSRIQKINVAFLVDRRSHLTSLLEEGRVEEVVSLAEGLPTEKLEEPEINQILFDAYQVKGNTERMIYHAENLWINDTENRDHWGGVLGRLYYQRATGIRGTQPLEVVRDLYQKSYQFGYRRAFFPFLWTSFLLMGGSSLFLLILAVLLLVLLVVFHRIRVSRYRR